MLIFGHIDRHRFAGRTRGVRVGVLAIATLCLAGQLGTMAHRFLVRHATCAEHGELVHPASVTSEITTRDPGIAHARSAETTSAMHGDDHCQVAAHTSRVSLDRPRIAGALALAIRSVPSLDDDAPPPPCIALFLLAPKNSPPS